MDRKDRRLKVHLPNTIHHVMMRGNNRQDIFFGKAYYECFLKIVSEASEKFNFKVITFCLMTNHIHLVIYVNQHSLSVIMQNICYRYVRWVHKKLNRVGHLFQGRYLSKIVNNEHYLLNLCRYVHLNPISAKMVQSIDCYRWSSHRYYRFRKAPEWLNIDIVFETISKQKNLTYHNLMSADISSDAWLPAFYISEDNTLVFNDKVLENCNHSFASADEPLKWLDMEFVVTVVIEAVSSTLVELRSSSRNRELAYKRALVTYFVREYTAEKLVDIACFFNRTPAAISKIYHKLRRSPTKYFDLQVLQNIHAVLDGELVK